MNYNEIIRCRLVFHGRVQGVGFRYVSQYAANEYGATGWVRNEYDGTVSMELQGTRAQIEQVILTLENSNYIRISQIDRKSIPTDPKEKRFRVRY
ncbi:acylphosphatase [Ruminococcus sp.]|uniref:acylphosphatase n=1 Tax=Ruminococcus sp. TaxID=41978 RepID=UPI002E7A1F5A|nr:acylphosphatase [Ruminococcus sp.]MEE1261527.1 acylphosphatase [Ruminococcus sp.]